MKRIRKVKQRNLTRRRQSAVRRDHWPLLEWGPPWKELSHQISQTHRLVKREGHRLRTAYRKEVADGTFTGTLSDYIRLKHLVESTFHSAVNVFMSTV